MKYPKISIIVPIYRTERYLRKCIDSILAQTFTDFELILVNDGSPDSCPAICDEYASIDSRINVIHKENSGQGSARNMGLDIAVGKYVGFIDSDDWTDPNMYKTLFNLCEKHNADISMCGICHIGRGECRERGESTRIEKNNILYKKNFMPLLLQDSICSHSVNKLYKKTMWDNVRFPVGFLEDMHVMPKVFENASRLAETKEKFYYYFNNRPDNTSNSFVNRVKNSYERGSAFRYRYTIAREKYPEIQKIVLNKAASHFASAFALMKIEQNYMYEDRIKEIFQFFQSHKKEIFSLKTFNLRVIIGVAMILYMQKIYVIVYKKLKKI